MRSSLRKEGALLEMRELSRSSTRNEVALLETKSSAGNEISLLEMRELHYTIETWLLERTHEK
jgi:hypothetical protein